MIGVTFKGSVPAFRRPPVADIVPVKSFSGKRLVRPPKANGRPAKLSTIMSLGAKVRPVQAVPASKSKFPPLPTIKGM